MQLYIAGVLCRAFGASSVDLQTRRLLLGLFVSALVVTAGCGALGNSADSTSTLKLVNQDSVEHSVVVEISPRSDVNNIDYTDGRIVKGESDVDLATFDGTGEYQVIVSVDGETTVLVHTFESGDEVINIGIDNDGEVSIE